MLFAVILLTNGKQPYIRGGTLLKKAGNLFITAYLVLIFGIYPFYMNEGYVDIGKAKYHFLLYCSLGAVGILALIGVLAAGKRIYEGISGRGTQAVHSGKAPGALRYRVSLTDLFVALYAVELAASYLVSDYRQEALWGTEGWYMGLVLQLTLCTLYFLISRLWDRTPLVFHVSCAASCMVFLLGILDRFSIYLIPLEIRQSDFISTLGNINWFCGYLSVLAPIGICRFLFGKKPGSRILYGFYTAVAFMAGFCQGSDSVFLFFGALFYILLWIAIKKGKWLRDYFLLFSVWGFSAQAVRFVRYCLPQAYNYDTDNLCAHLTSSDFMLWVGLISLGGYFLLLLLIRKREKLWLGRREQRIIHRGMAGMLLGAAALWIFIALVNTRTGIPGLEGKGLFVLDENWGNGRGAAMISAIEMFQEMPVIHKFLGAGPDCFSVFAYSLPRVAARLNENFGSSRLTNAHNELLTCLVNLGVSGVCLLVGIMVSFVRRCMREGKENDVYYILAVCVICYFVHNMVSFAQVLNFPFLFMLFGMAENRVIDF